MFDWDTEWHKPKNWLRESSKNLLCEHVFVEQKGRERTAELLNTSHGTLGDGGMFFTLGRYTQEGAIWLCREHFEEFVFPVYPELEALRELQAEVFKHELR